MKTQFCSNFRTCNIGPSPLGRGASARPDPLDFSAHVGWTSHRAKIVVNPNTCEDEFDSDV